PGSAYFPYSTLFRSSVAPATPPTRATTSTSSIAARASRCLLPKAPSPATHIFIFTSPSSFAIAVSRRRQPLARASAGPRRRRAGGERRGGGVDQLVDGGGTVAAVHAAVGQPVDPLARDQGVLLRDNEELAQQ